MAADMPLGAPQYPVNLIVSNRRCLVVGGGTVGARKAAGLLECGARVHVVAGALGPELSALLDTFGSGGQLTFEARPYRTGEAAEYRLVVAATDDEGVNRAVFEDGEASGVWVNSADEPAASSFTLPSVLRQGPVMVTVSTGGQSPALATWLRSVLADQLGPEYERLAEMVSEERRAIRAEGRSTEGLDWQKAFNSDMLDLLRAGQEGLARERLRECLSSS